MKSKKISIPRAFEVSRRGVAQSMLAAALGGYFTSRKMGLLSGKANASTPEARFFVCITLAGGASMFDSFMAKTNEEVANTGGDPSALNCFDTNDLETGISVRGPLKDGEIVESRLRAVKMENITIPELGNINPDTSQQQIFLDKNYENMAIFPNLATSVNHGIGQHRSITGNDAWNGRTLQECAAMHYGSTQPLANLMFADGGFSRGGIDASVPEYAKQVVVSDALYFAFGLSGYLGLTKAPMKTSIDLARRWRNTSVDVKSNFFKTFKNSPTLSRWLTQRNEIIDRFEGQELAKRLFFLDSKTPLKASPEAINVRSVFNDYAVDPLDAQAIAGYLSLTSNSSTAITLGPSFAAAVKPVEEGVSPLTGFINTPIGFDLSHQNHRGTQAMQWNRALRVAGKLIELLKGTPFASSGKSYWEHTVMYFATDFGRDRIRPTDAQSWGTGHHVENASLIVSPLLRGNSIFGGAKIDQDSRDFKLYGFNRQTGATDENENIATEKEIFTALLTLLDVDLQGMPEPADFGFLKQTT
jgi:hypothetical protein